jgi:hypothetical protein
LIAAAPLSIATAQTAPAPNAMRTDGRFVLIQQSTDDTGPVAGYLRLPEGGVGADGQAVAWMTLFYDQPRTEDGLTIAFAVLGSTVDCTKRLARPDRAAAYGADGQVLDTQEIGGDWQSAREGTPLVKVIAVICDGAQPAGPPLDGVAAARADAAKRLGGG